MYLKPVQESRESALTNSNLLEQDYGVYEGVDRKDVKYLEHNSIVAE